jgi:hypothetical protein
MKKTHRTTIVLVLLACLGADLHAQLTMEDLTVSEAMQKAADGITTVAEMIISDSFTPMTGFDEGDLTFIASPTLFRIEQAHEDPLVEGKDFGGWSAGVGAGRAFRGRWLMYGILSGMHMNGGLELQPYEVVSDRVEADASYTFISLNGGVGYELFEKSWLSVPVFFGPHLQFYSAEIVPEEVDYLTYTYTFTSTVTGSGLMFGVSGGIAAYVEVLGRFAFTPYVLGLANLTRPGFEADVTAQGSGLPIFYTDSFDIDPTLGVLFGLDVGYRSRSGWTYSFALGDLIAYVFEYGNTLVKDGIRMRPLVLIVSYSR